MEGASLFDVHEFKLNGHFRGLQNIVLSILFAFNYYLIYVIIYIF